VLLDLRYGARGLLRNPGFAVLVAAILALGIGANSAVFSIVNAVLLRPLPYHDPGSLYRVEELNPKGDPAGISIADILAFEKATRVFEKACVARWQNVTLTGHEGPENVFGGRVSADCLNMLGRQPVLGRLFRDDEFKASASDVILLSDRMFQRRFARNPDIIGRTLMVSGKPHTIAGVMPPDFFLEQRFEFWTPWRLTAEETSAREMRFGGIMRLKT
jgi:putative ABC transport system permease protein